MMDMLGIVALVMIGIGFAGLVVNLLTPRRGSRPTQTSKPKRTGSSETMRTAPDTYEDGYGFVPCSYADSLGNKELKQKIEWLNVVPGSEEWAGGHREVDPNWKDPSKDDEPKDVKALRERLGLERL